MKRAVWLVSVTLGLVMGLLVLWAGITAFWLKGSLPNLSGEVTAQGTESPLRIVRDAHGVPHIFAASFNDALFGLGYVHAQDRLWQMEFQRRTVQGRLAELAGEPAVVADTYLRALGLYRAARSSVNALSPDARQAFEAYAAGVNAALPRKGKPLPPEFFMLGTGFSEWTAADSAGVLKGLAVQLSANAFQEIARLQLMKQLGEDGAAAFSPPLPASVIEAYRAYAPKAPTRYAALDAPLAALAGVLETRGASNNWVVGGSKTKSGKPMLANDPHLPLTVPAFWYLAHLSWPGGEAIGGSVPGIPAIIAGRSRHLAWGLTTTGADTQDLFWETVDPGDPGRYLTPSGSERFDVRAETIKVRFGKPRLIRIQSTRHGPVLPTDDPRVRALVPDGHVLALRWPALDGNDRTGETALAMMRTTDARRETITRLFSTYNAPIQSFVYAGTDGNIGLILPGRIPVRDPANPVMGLLPANGRDRRFDWKGFIPEAEAPLWTGGSGDMFLTANNNVVPQGYSHMIALDFDSEHRARRIRAELDSHAGRHDMESFRALQLDTAEQFAMDVLDGMRAQVKGETPRARDALALLDHWDRHMTADRPEPLLFAAWMKEFTRRLFADELGELFQRYWNDRPDFITAVIKGDPAAVRFCDDRQTKDVRETCGRILTESLDTAVGELTSAHGADMKAWRWGEAHRATFSHTPFGFLPVLRDMFGLSEPVGGGNSVVQRAAYRFGGNDPFAAVHGSGYRAIYDLGAPEKSLFMISTGQSGNVWSPHYGDLAPGWAQGGYLEMVTDRQVIERTASAVLVVRPAGQPMSR